MPCECTLAGFCARHQVAKSQAWVALCQSRPDYFQLWQDGRGPGQPIDPTIAVRQALKKTQQDQETRELWAELHTTQDATPEWFALWVVRVPSYGCGCRSWLKRYLRTNPPNFNSFFEWGWNLHLAVSRKLSKPELTLDEAKAIWLRD